MAQSRRSLWAKRVERWKDSGLTVKEFASETGLNANTLSHWSWRLGKERATEPSKKTTRPAKKQSGKTPAAGSVQFIEVSPPPAVSSDARFEIELRGGRRVFVPACFDGEALGRLLDVVEAR